MSDGWDGAFLATWDEYNGRPLAPRSCENCGKYLLTDEALIAIKEYGMVCVDCEDYILEEVKQWK